MSRLNNLSISQKLTLLVGTFMIGFAAFAWLAQRTLQHVAVNGPIYHKIVQSKDIVADVLPPPEYIIESYLLALELDRETEPARAQRLIERGNKLKAEYLTRHQYWTKEQLEPSLRDALLVRSYTPAIEFYAVWDQELIPAVLRGDRQRIDQLVGGPMHKHYEDHRRAVDDVVAIATRATQEYEAEALADVTSRTTLLFGMAAVIALLAVAIAWLIARSLFRRLQASSVALISTATQISATSKQQQSTVNSYSASSTQVAAAVKEISATSHELQSTLADISTAATRSAGLAESGRAGLDGMDATMQQLAQATGSISSKLSTIREKANDINLVVTTITKVADQTNLLSVNAAIEAEKAGEFGLGFLVVAREIRRLADQSAVASLDIEQTVRHMQASVSAGVMEMDKFAEEVRRGVSSVSAVNGQLGQIIEQVQSLSERIEALNEGMHSQAQGASQISEAMAHLTEGARQTAASLTEFNSATDSLRDVVANLRRELTSAQA